VRPSRLVAAVVLAFVALVGGVALGGGGEPTVSAACSVSTNLRIGSTGEQVRCLQSTLNDLGYNSGPVDGQFGPITQGAVMRYQQAKRLSVDGWVGPQSGGSLGIWGTSSGTGGGAGGSTGGGSTGGGTTVGGSTASCSIATSLRTGSTGEQVRCLQSTLNDQGYNSGPVDGQFGPVTHGAVVRYQQAKGLKVDGVVGPQTGGALAIWGPGGGSGGGGGGSGGGGGAQCTPPDGVPAGARQVVVVTSSGSSADVDLLVFSGGQWTCARMDMPGRVGSNGVRALTSRRSGDDTTPGGIFALGSMTAPDGQTFQFFGNGVNPGVNGTWRQIKAGDCWGATPGTAAYNQLVTRSAAECQSPDEYLINFQQSYSRAAIIAANMGANRSGDAPGEPAYAAAIFLHRHTFDANGNARPTSGCVSLGNDNLIFVLQRLVPGQAYFVIR
jgi:peptidoglycan hydrolase-like protein with peptidoglycan-binding domain/L,D-peptidoglycan transpeptidase YkuD (ErfK/YbiS/YcfS/YnhG family)